MHKEMNKNPLLVDFDKVVDPKRLFACVCDAWVLGYGEINIVIHDGDNVKFTAVNIEALKQQLMPAFVKFTKNINTAKTDKLPGFAPKGGTK